jgi:hypothetical protein
MMMMMSVCVPDSASPFHEYDAVCFGCVIITMHTHGASGGGSLNNVQHSLLLTGANSHDDDDD